MSINISDLEKLQNSEFEIADRIELATKIGEYISDKRLGEQEKSCLRDIIALLADDKEAEVRKILAESLSISGDLPISVAEKLSFDMVEIAIPILCKSPVLSENSLIKLVAELNDINKLEAIASRDYISSSLSKILLKLNFYSVSIILLGNKAAVIMEDSMNNLIDNEIKQIANCSSHDSEVLIDLLADREPLSPTMIWRIFDIASDKTRIKLIKKHDIPVTMLHDLAENLDHDFDIEKTRLAYIEQATEHLYAANKLTPSTILKALCNGDLAFFESALARLADIPVNNARLLVLDVNGNGFSGLYQAAKLPKEFFPSMRQILMILFENNSYGKFFRRDFPSMLAAEIGVRGYDKKIAYMDYVLRLINNNKEVAKSCQNPQ